MKLIDHVRELAQSGEGPVSSNEELIDLVDKEPPKEPRLAGIIKFRPGGSEIALLHGLVAAPSRGGDGVSDQLFANKHIVAFSRTYGFDLLVPKGAYYRWTNCKDEPTQALAGALAPSFNHRAKVPENGFSVAEGPWLYCRDHAWCWFASGRELAVSFH